MKVSAAVAALALSLFAEETAAFSVSSVRPAVSTARTSSLFMKDAEEAPEAPVAPVEKAPPAPKGMVKVEANEDIYAGKNPTMRIEGGGTLKTFQMPANAERVQYVLTSPGNRPVKAKVELWIGPIRCVHEFIYDSMDGKDYPIRATLQFKKLSPVLKISTDDGLEFPLECGVFVPEEEESKAIGKTCANFFDTAELKEKIQGGTSYGGKNTGGAIRSFDIDPSWDKTQIMVWSKDVGKKSFKTNIEVLQGPNNAKQHLNLRCGGSTQPFHCVIDTPGNGWVVRLNSKKFLEDGLFEVALAPYGETIDAKPAAQVVMGGGGF